jgi:hypothetical protein
MKRSNPCPNAGEGCPLFNSKAGCHTDIHHELWPAYQYSTPVERQFRELSENKVRMCRNEHNELHATEFPPHKPTLRDMLAALAIEATEEPYEQAA